MPHRKDNFWQVRMETQHRGYLKMSVQNKTFDSENGAWKFIERMKKKYPECNFYIGPMEPAVVRKFKLDLDGQGPADIDF